MLAPHERQVRRKIQCAFGTRQREYGVAPGGLGKLRVAAAAQLAEHPLARLQLARAQPAALVPTQVQS